jgi:hypothetical protein
MCGHLAHGPYPSWYRGGDAASVLLLGMASILALRSNLPSRRLFAGLAFGLPAATVLANCLGFVLIPPLLWMAIRGLFNARGIPAGFCQCGYDLQGNISGVCPECGMAIP